jgi:putative IMPACT (imprinted ancient) family translation regulator
VMLVVSYPLFERVKLLVESWQGRILDETFAADITLTIQFWVERFDSFQAALRELSHGSIEAEIVESNDETIMPLGSFAEID